MGDGHQGRRPAAQERQGDPLDRPLCRVRRTTQFSHTQSAAWVVIPMQAEDIDTHGMWSTGNTYDMISVRSGFYRVAGGTYVAGAPTVGRLVVKLTKYFTATATWSATWIGRAVTHGTGSGLDPGVETNGLLYLAAGDRIRLEVFQDIAGTILLGTVDWQPTYLEAEFIRP